MPKPTEPDNAVVPKTNETSGEKTMLETFARMMTSWLVKTYGKDFAKGIGNMWKNFNPELAAKLYQKKRHPDGVDKSKDPQGLTR